MPVNLDIRNPLELPDVGAWNNPYIVAEQLLVKSKFGRDHKAELEEIYAEGEELVNQFEDNDAWVESPEAFDLLDDIQRIIKDDGYDGVKYLNDIEAEGSMTLEGKKKYAALLRQREDLRSEIFKREALTPEQREVLLKK